MLTIFKKNIILKFQNSNDNFCGYGQKEFLEKCLVEKEP